MLRLLVVMAEDFDDEKQEFLVTSSVTIELEHSLVSLSKWEAKWEIPFLDSSNKTNEQVLDYVRMMFLGEEFPEHALEFFKESHYEQINNYINAKMTATTLHERNQTPSKEIVTAEIIYYWMIALGIPQEFQYWHLNRLLMLVKVCNAKNGKPEKMSKQQMLAERQKLNAERRAATGSRG